ncbi:MAG: glycosyltransferase family 2 protein [Dehalococcoidales bacterium]|nr:glycosyltransferase family 2 protein [Dehalococcoidales bacterium]
MNRSPKIIVAMPAFNEEKYVGSLVLQVKQYADEVVVVDDGSRDRTARVAELAGATVVRHGENKGYGSAIQSIMSEARKRNADVLVILDADSQHNPDEIPVLVKAVADGADVVIGSREMQSNSIPAFRRTGQRVLARLTNIASRKNLSDTESGFRAYSKKAIINLELKETGMAISSEIISAAARKGLKLAEVPISVTYAGDTSTMNPVRHGVGVLTRILVMISERRPLLFFSAAGAVCIVAGAILGLLVVLTLRSQQVMQVGTALLSMLFITVGSLSIFTGLILNVLIKRIGDSGLRAR